MELSISLTPKLLVKMTFVRNMISKLGFTFENLYVCITQYVEDSLSIIYVYHYLVGDIAHELATTTFFISRYAIELVREK